MYVKYLYPMITFNYIIQSINDCATFSGDIQHMDPLWDAH